MSLPRASVNNPVAVNLLMWGIVIAGIVEWNHLRREFFPNIDADQIAITVAYPGATPEEVEKAVARRIEREIEDVDDIEEIETLILEGMTSVVCQLEEGANLDRTLNALRGEIDKVKPDLPDGAEEPEIQELEPRIPVIGVVVSGEVAEEALRDAAQDLADEILDLPNVTELVMSGMRDREIWVTVLPERLEEHHLTFQEVGQRLAASNLDLPGGQIKGLRGNVRVRTTGERNRGYQLESVVVRGNADGSALRLVELAQVQETFEDRVEQGRFDGKPAVLLTVFKTPDQDAIQISREVKGLVAAQPTRLGGAIQVKTMFDLARFIEQRLDLMIRNARMGLILVVLVLLLFLDVKVAFWVAWGLPVAFLGTFVAMDLLGATVNLISLFGLIVVLGLIVDDAIVIGENIFTHLREGMPPREAAARGAEEVTRPVLAAVLTSIVAFLPLAFIEGRVGTMLGVLPVVVIAALGVSLIEALIILPAHLAHPIRFPAPEPTPGVRGWLDGWRRAKHGFLEQRLPDTYERLLRFLLRWRYVTMAAAFAFSILVVGLVAGGIVPFELLQEVDAETVMVDIQMAAGTPEARTAEVVSQIEQKALSFPEMGRVFAVIGVSFGDQGRQAAADPATVGQITLELLPADEREARGMRTSKHIVSEIRRTGLAIPGISRFSVSARAGGPHGPDVAIRIRSDDLGALTAAVAHVREELARYDGVTEIDDDLEEGKLEARLQLREAARSLELTTRSLALVTRHALYGYEVQDLQKEDDEVTVRVLLPEAARRDLSALGRLRLATPTGGRVPLEEVALLTTARGDSSLTRVDGKRAITVKAEVDDEIGNVSEITEDLTRRLADIGQRFPGVTVSFEGQRKETRESIGSLSIGFPAALLVIYGLIAVLFRSYIQPIIVMGAIPYALVGAVVGHLIMGYPFTLLSLIGGVALAGIVVNDSLILVDRIDGNRRSGLPLLDALVQAGRRRLRAILLTSITTIAGLAPLMLERSFQAQFLIPMAVSIVFGLAFATFLTLVLVPAAYLVLEDLLAGLRWLVRGPAPREPVPSAAASPDDSRETGPE